LRVTIQRGGDQSNDGYAGQYFTGGGPFTVTCAGGLQARAGEREYHGSSQNHLFHNFNFWFERLVAFISSDAWI
jgi:hypothetical protein